MCSLRFSLQRRQIQISMLAFDKSMFAAMAFYLLKIHKGIQIMSKNAGAQKIADTLCTRMLGNSPVCQNSGVGKKGEMLESCQQRQQRGKKQISNRRQKKSFQPMLLARLARRTREHQPERIACLGIESSGSRTHDLLLRRAKKRSPLSASECLQMPKYQRFPPFSDVRISSKNRLFYPVRVSRVLAASNFGGRPFSHDVRFC